jgi:hypothetical protein
VLAVQHGEPRLRYQHRSLAAVAFAFAATSHAGPPYQTDDPEPVALHKYEINVAVQQTLTTSGRTGALPLVEVNYGAAPDVQLHVGVPFAFNRPAREAFRHGLGDVELGVKYRWSRETDTTPMIAVYPTYVMATGSAERGLGNGQRQIFLPVWLQKSWGPWTIDLGGGYWINRAAGARDNWYAGGLVQRQVSEGFRLGAEAFRRSPQATDEPASTGFNVGATYDIDAHRHLLVSIGTGLRNRPQTNQLSTYIGYQITD